MPSDDWSVHPFPPNKHVHFSPLRRVQTRRDSDGVEHHMLVQTEEMSCGPAAVAMLMNVLHPAPDPESLAFTDMRLKAIAARYPGSMVQEDARTQSQGPHSGHQGSTSINTVDLMRDQGILVALEQRGFFFTRKPTAIMTARVQSRPALVLWGWYDRHSNRNGGHFTVAARVTKAGRIVILDPIDGSLSEIQPLTAYKSNGLMDLAVYTK